MATLENPKNLDMKIMCEYQRQISVDAVAQLILHEYCIVRSYDMLIRCGLGGDDHPLARQRPLCLSIRHNSKCATVCGMDCPLTQTTLPRGLYGLQTNATPALHLPCWWGWHPSGCCQFREDNFTTAMAVLQNAGDAGKGKH